MSRYQYGASYDGASFEISASNLCTDVVTTGLHDSQVQYWEPAKWVARLRIVHQGDNMILLTTNMDAGHGGASGRFDRYKEVAFRHAFLLKLAGIKE